MFLFGKKKNVEVNPQKSISDLKDILETLEKREKFLELRINNLKTSAKNALKEKNKRKAMLFLKKTKLNEKQLESIYNKRELIDVQILTIEQSLNDKHFIKAMKQGKDVIKGIVKDVNVDSVDELMDDITEGISMVNEFSDALKNPVGPVMDEEELLDELEKEMNEKDEVEKIENKLKKEPEVSSVQQLPLVKKNEDKTVENEMKELEQMMA